jgi:hypothetical protein
VTAPLLTDQDESMGSDSKDEEEGMVYDHECAEAGNDVLKQKSIKMKDVDTRKNKGLKVSKEKPKKSALKITKIKDPKKIKSEMPDELKTKPKPKLRPKDATKYQSNDNRAQDDMVNNMGVHNMSSSPDTERDMDEDDEHDGAIKTKGQGLKMVDVKARNVKDKLVTTPSGEVVRRENYVIPKILR